MVILMAAFPRVIVHDLLAWPGRGYSSRGFHVVLPPIMALLPQVSGLNIFISNIYLETGERTPRWDPLWDRLGPELHPTPSFQRPASPHRAIIVFRIPWYSFQCRLFLKKTWPPHPWALALEIRSGPMIFPSWKVTSVSAQQLASFHFFFLFLVIQVK